MEDHKKTKEQLLEELSQMRSLVATSQAVEIERKRSEEAVQESEKRFRSLFQDSSIGAAVVTPNGQFIQTNRAFCDFVGYSERELLGKTVLSITHPEYREVTSNAIHQVFTSGPQRYGKTLSPQEWSFPLG